MSLSLSLWRLRFWLFIWSREVNTDCLRYFYLCGSWRWNAIGISFSQTGVEKLCGQWGRWELIGFHWWPWNKKVSRETTHK